MYLRSAADAAPQPVPWHRAAAARPPIRCSRQTDARWRSGPPATGRSSASPSAAAVDHGVALSEGGLGIQWVGDHIYIGDKGEGIIRVSANGGKPEPVVVPTGREEFYGPQLLADGDTLLFTLGTRGMPSWDQAGSCSVPPHEAAEDADRGRDERPLRANGPSPVRPRRRAVRRAFDSPALAVGGEPVAVIEGCGGRRQARPARCTSRCRRPGRSFTCPAGRRPRRPNCNWRCSIDGHGRA